MLRLSTQGRLLFIFVCNQIKCCLPWYIYIVKSNTWYMKSIKGNKIEMGEHKWILEWIKSNKNKGKIKLIWVQDEKLDYAVRISKTLILKYCSFRISWFVKDSKQTSKEQSLRTSWTENELAWIPQNQKSKCENWWCLA